jgi:vacuolar protein-sorting-associated protein 4
MDIGAKELEPPIVTMHDFQASIETMRPSVGPDDLKKQEEFTSQFGMEG